MDKVQLRHSGDEGNKMEFSKLKLFSTSIMEECVFNLETRGYHVFEKFYDDEICQYLKSKLVEAIESYIPIDTSERSFQDKYHMHDMLCKDLLFAKMLEDPRLNQVVASILGDYWILYAHTSTSIPPNAGNYGSRIHVDCPRVILNYPTNVGVIWTLDDFTIDNGATYVLPGSHNTKITPSKEIFEKNSIRLLCKRGALILFNARVWHRAGINHTNEFRHALTLNACRPYMKQRMDWVRFIPKDITDQLNSQARRIIGFDTRLPSSLQEMFVPEADRLYLSGQE